jgi:hypothetical protein
MASYAVGKVVEYRTSEGSWLDAVVLVDNTSDNCDLLVRHDNGPFYKTKLAIALGTTYGTFRVK